MTPFRTELELLSAHVADCLGELDAPPILAAEASRRRAENVVLAAVIAVKRARAGRRDCTTPEQELVRRAVEHVRRGVPLPARFQPIARFGRRRHQTLLSLADDGCEHLRVLLRDPDLLDGVVIHHEVTDRAGPGRSHDPAVVPYRLIDIRLNAEIRLWAADDVPVTVYGGRPSYQPWPWDAGTPARDVAAACAADQLSPCHGVAAVASAAFANGVADVKFSLDGLRVSQALTLMKQVKEAVVRREGQLLSTQFHLNRPVGDDRNGESLEVCEAAAIARLSVAVTKKGGWDRVTLDSAGTKVPSEPLFKPLPFEEVFRWVHKAHSAGLETYISGGMDVSHIPSAVRAGVDGVGFGYAIHGGQGSTHEGRIDPGVIKAMIKARNEAEDSVPGRAAWLLARLDDEYGTPNRQMAAGRARLRNELFKAIGGSKDEKHLDQYLKDGEQLGLSFDERC